MADWLDQLEGPERNAAAALIDLFTSYGLESLAPRIVQFAQEGYGADTMTLLLQDTPEYKQRFAANQRRVAKGLAVLSPAEYLQVEAGYRQALQAAGMPVGFYDEITDFQDWIAMDISPNEVADRANTARRVADTVDPLQRSALARLGIGVEDLAAYYLDANRALPILQRQVDIAMLGAERERAGFQFSEQVGQSLFQQGVTVEEARSGFSAIAQALPTFEKLGEIDDDSFTLTDLEADVFGQDPQATTRRRRLASQERARFSGSSGATQGTLSRDTRFN